MNDARNMFSVVILSEAKNLSVVFDAIETSEGFLAPHGIAAAGHPFRKARSPRPSFDDLPVPD